MPHMTIEYSANLDGRTDMGAFCSEILQAMLATGYFEIGAVRVRAVRCAEYAIADRMPENAFIDMSLRIGQRPDRTPESRKEVGEAIFRKAADFLAPLFETPHFALSFEIRDIDPDLSWKKNAMHPRLRNQ
ncbi:MAG TPA: 5-carboxymethyl-2-hydroxymuconate Delta-isomerase [Rhizobiaceae bacterium]|nr:5-carboxymethyl-2-hydroxymuconate Delta-isomerase [Rhizobiaceae bacterium]